MNSLRSTERRLSILTLPYGALRRTQNSSAPRISTDRRQYFGNHVSARYNAPSIIYGPRKIIKLHEVTQNRRLASSHNHLPPPASSLSFKNVRLLNPDKPNPEDEESPTNQPIVPLTMPRFPKTNGSSDSVPSVTKVLSATMPASSQYMLDRWKEAMIKKLGVAGFNKYQQDTFQRGRILHSVIANFLLGLGDPTEEQISTDVVANLWKSIQHVVKYQISSPRLVEHIVTHPEMNYRGIVDCVAVYKDELVVIDFKTAEKPKKNVESLYDNPLQVTAYCGALNNDKAIPKHVIGKNICSGLVVVAYIDGSEASVYYLEREKLLNDYWKQWTKRLEQYARIEAMRLENPENIVLKRKH